MYPKVGGILVNTGHSVEWRALSSLSESNYTSLRTANRDSLIAPPANVSGGPLSYTYSLTHARLHFGERDMIGSEHTLNKLSFPAEVRENEYILLSLVFDEDE